MFCRHALACSVLSGQVSLVALHFFPRMDYPFRLGLPFSVLSFSVLLCFLFPSLLRRARVRANNSSLSLQVICSSWVSLWWVGTPALGLSLWWIQNGTMARAPCATILYCAGKCDPRDAQRARISSIALLTTTTHQPEHDLRTQREEKRTKTEDASSAIPKG